MWLLLVAAVALTASEPVACSANGRFCLSAASIETDDDAPAWRMTIAELQPWGEYLTVRTFVAAPEGGKPLISNDGHTIVFAPTLYPEAKFAILRDDGIVVAEMNINDVVSEDDRDFVPRRSERWSIRAGPDGKERLVLSLPASAEDSPETTRGEIEIDLQNGKRIGPMHDIYPKPQVSGAEVADNAPPPRAWGQWRCAEDARMNVTSRELTPVNSASLYASAVALPLPKFPRIMRLVRFDGDVQVEVIVDRTGAVTCARSTVLPFGGDAAVEAVMLHWRFQRRSAPSIGRVMIRFRQ
jgi:hypothetical protein